MLCLAIRNFTPPFQKFHPKRLHFGLVCYAVVDNQLGTCPVTGGALRSVRFMSCPNFTMSQLCGFVQAVEPVQVAFSSVEMTLNSNMVVGRAK